MGAGAGEQGAGPAAPPPARAWRLSERCALAVLAACLVVGLLGGRWWPITDPATGLAHRLSLIELIAGGDADLTAPRDRLQPPLAILGDGSRSLCGTDELGRSLFLRLSCALGASITVAGSAALLALGIGMLGPPPPCSADAGMTP